MANQPKIRLVHLLTFPDDPVEKESAASLSPLAEFGVEYVQRVNQLTKHLPALKPMWERNQWGGPLKPGYFGGWNAHRGAVEQEFTDEVDFLIICERDCVLDVSASEFHRRLLECCAVIQRYGVDYFSFGDSTDPATGVLQSNFKTDLDFGIYTTGKIIRCHCIMFPKASRDFLLEKFGERVWFASDIWYNQIFQSANKKMAIVKSRLAQQIEGFSIIDVVTPPAEIPAGPQATNQIQSTWLHAYHGIVRRPNNIRTHFAVNFVDGPHLSIAGVKGGSYEVEFIDKSTNTTVHKDVISRNHWTAAARQYYTNWRVRVTDQDSKQVVFDYEMDLKAARVLFGFESKALGDTIAWMPYVEQFTLKHQCKAVCSTFWNNLFAEAYPDIEFVNPGSAVNNLNALYRIGSFNFDDRNLSPAPWNTMPLQAIASSLLGLPHEELKPKIKQIGGRWIRKPYVCIATEATTECKYWNHPGGWKDVVLYLRKQGYEVLNLSKDAKHIRGSYPLDSGPIEIVMSYLNGAEYFVGLSSGLSWLAWAMNKPVVMISGFSEPWNEFTSNCVRVYPDANVCRGCYNKKGIQFDRTEGRWCPIHKNTEREFECSKAITPKEVIVGIEKLGIKNEENNRTITEPDIARTIPPSPDVCGGNSRGERETYAGVC